MKNISLFWQISRGHSGLLMETLVIIRMDYSSRRKKFKMGYLSVVAIFLMVIQSATGQIPKDKQLHMGTGAVIGAWGYLIPSEAEGWKPIIYGLGGATITAIGKEAYDYMSYRNFDRNDLGATLIGGVISVGIMAGVKAIIKKGHRRAYFTMKQRNNMEHTQKAETNL